MSLLMIQNVILEAAPNTKRTKNINGKICTLYTMRLAMYFIANVKFHSVQCITLWNSWIMWNGEPCHYSTKGFVPCDGFHYIETFAYYIDIHSLTNIHNSLTLVANFGVVMCCAWTHNFLIWHVVTLGQDTWNSNELLAMGSLIVRWISCLAHISNDFVLFSQY